MQRAAEKGLESATKIHTELSFIRKCWQQIRMEGGGIGVELRKKYIYNTLTANVWVRSIHGMAAIRCHCDTAISCLQRVMHSTPCKPLVRGFITSYCSK